MGGRLARREGESLVVDVTNFSDKTNFKGGIAENRYLKGLDEKHLHLPGFDTTSFAERTRLNT
jgi:hypothetical protein